MASRTAIRAGSIDSYFGFPAIPDQNPWLDLVRALAVVLVLVRHGERALTDTRPGAPPFLHDVFMNGWIGVDLFFVLSGYLIASALFRRSATQPFELRRYLAIRVLRILPAYFAVLAVTAGGLFPFFKVDDGGLAWRVIYHVLLLQDYLPSDINVVFWSLGVEEKFYLLAPFAVAALALCRSWRMAMLLLLAVFALPSAFRALSYGAHAEWTYDLFFREMRSPLHMSLEPLVTGVAIAYARHAGLIPATRPKGAPTIAICVLMLVLLGSHDFMARITLWDGLVQPAMISLFCGFLVVTALRMPSAEMKIHGPVRVVARLSYTLYLVHYPLIPFALALSGRHPAFWFWFVPLSFAAAAILHFAVEKPFLLLKERVAATPRPTH